MLLLILNTAINGNNKNSNAGNNNNSSDDCHVNGTVDLEVLAEVDNDGKKNDIGVS